MLVLDDENETLTREEAIQYVGKYMDDLLFSDKIDGYESIDVVCKINSNNVLHIDVNVKPVQAAEWIVLDIKRIKVDKDGG